MLRLGSPAAIVVVTVGPVVVSCRPRERQKQLLWVLGMPLGLSRSGRGSEHSPKDGWPRRDHGEDRQHDRQDSQCRGKRQNELVRADTNVAVVGRAIVSYLEPT